MQNLTLNQAFRYLLSGFITLLFLLIYDSSLAACVYNNVGPIGAVGVSLAVGALLYTIYRPLIYNWLIVWLQDRCRNKANPSYRFYLREVLKNWYPNLSTTKVVQLYVLLRRDKELEKRYYAAAVPAGNVHYAYMASFLSISFLILSFFYRKPNTRMFIYITPLLFVGAFLFDRRLEQEETSLLRTIPIKDIKRTADMLFSQILQENELESSETTN